ncbi:MAG: hypothetical protein M3Y85_01250 [Bacteroidota bacterium]|nr:hypothetical protein [Bacteroidota bacterium]
MKFEDKKIEVWGLEFEVWSLGFGVGGIGLYTVTAPSFIHQGKQKGPFRKRSRNAHEKNYLLLTATHTVLLIVGGRSSPTGLIILG